MSQNDGGVSAIAIVSNRDNAGCNDRPIFLEREAVHRIIISQVSSILRLASPNISGFDIGYVSSTAPPALVAQIICPLTTLLLDHTPARSPANEPNPNPLTLLTLMVPYQRKNGATSRR